MMKIGAVIRNVFLVAITFILVFLAAVQLMQIQIVDGDYYASQRDSLSEANQSITAARGQISDTDGTLLVTNRIRYEIIVQKAFLTVGMENEIIARTITILEECGEKWVDNAPLTADSPFEFTTDNETELDRFRENLKLNYDATAEHCIKALTEQYGIDAEKYDTRMIRKIAGVRYEMTQKDFSAQNPYTLAQDISIDAVLRLKEQGFLLSGIDIVEKPERIYLRSSTAPHVIGTIGQISEDEYNATKDENGETQYKLNDVIGKTGIEDGMEEVLKGTDGIRTIVRSNGIVISDDITLPVEPGNSLKLTIDAHFQDQLQTILENHINWLHYYNDPIRGGNCDAGAVVVLDVKTGAVLGMASYPTYDINDYIADPAAVMSGVNGASMYNLATQGLYRPGSSFKTINAAACLIEGIVDRNSTVVCNHIYTFYAPSYSPKCTGTHGAISVVSALKWSCNIYFYDLGRRLGIDKLAAYANLFGYGEDLGLEIDCNLSKMTTPELYNANRAGTDEVWTDGDVLQAAIGQCDTEVSPLNLAVQALTLANKGTRLRPHLVDSVWNYDYTEMISHTQPEIASQIDDKGTNAFDIVREGMIQVSYNCTWPIYGGGSLVFDYLPDDVAIKTGTPERDGSGEMYNSTVMGYYPAHDPQIAFGIVLEKADFSRYMIRNIIDAYFYDCYEPDMDEEGNIVAPWKRWTDKDKTPIR